ncbi:NAD(P)/FAD-dependent oxidoreductase [Rhodococcus sp. WS4]|nr:NAD(P)/FAD-dependent oxidoreductase [Rhodococcus sp. WS4]
MADEFDAIVVGAGIAGLYSLHTLRERGFSAQVFEAGEGVGGTWYWNTYPGCRVDVESLEYSYGFSDELQQEWEWTERWPGQPEVERYLNHVADRFDMRRDIKFSTRVVAAHFDEEQARWNVTTDDGQVHTAQHLVMASGTISATKDPRQDFKGLDEFKGEWYMTSGFPTEGVDFSGKRVAVVGTGSTGVQLIPIAAEQAGHLTVLQRTPAFTLPAKNRPMDPEFQTAMKARYPEHRALAKTMPFGVPIELPTISLLADEPENVQRRLEACWQEGGVAPLMNLYTDVLVDEKANEVVAEFVREKIRSIVDDSQVADLLCPNTYPFGAKRPCLGTDYYETFNRDNVSLVSVRENPIDTFTEKGVRLRDGQELEFDMIVFAIGFDAITGALNNIDLRGRAGMTIKEAWANGPNAYLGLLAADFPNMYILTGPGSVSVLANMYTSIEQHVDWVADLLVDMRERGRATVEASHEAQEKWMAHVAEVGDATLFPRADSWYVGANVEGKPRGLMLYVAGLGVYRGICDEVAAKGYEGIEFQSDPVGAV